MFSGREDSTLAVNLLHESELSLYPTIVTSAKKSSCGQVLTHVKKLF